MKVAIVGSGAMGSLFGALLTESGEEVWLLDTWSEHVATINRDGLKVEREGVQRIVAAKATTDPLVIGSVDLGIVFVKSTQTRIAAEIVRDLTGSAGRVLTLQNGMGNADIISKFVAPHQVLSGTTSHGATLLGPGSIRHAGKGPTVIGSWADGDPGVSEQIARVLNKAGIDTETVTDVRRVVWEKLMINVGINAITALTDIKNGELLDREATRALSQKAVEEAMAVARAGNIPVRNDTVEHVFEVARATSVNRSSMGQDVDNRRITEIDAINGIIVREGEKYGIDTPVNRTLWALIETLQAHY